MSKFRLWMVACIAWFGVLILALPQGHSFVDRLVVFAWFLIALVGFYRFIRSEDDEP